MLKKGLKRIISLFIIFVLIVTTGMMTVHGRGQEDTLQLEIFLQGNGGTPQTQVAKVAEGERLSVALQQITMPHREYTFEWQGKEWTEVHEFIGWFTTPQGDGIQVHPTDVMTQDSPRTLYARWRGGAAPAVILMFFGNGGTPQEQWMCYSQVTNATFAEVFASIEEPRKEGYTFLGWRCWGGWDGSSNHTQGEIIQPHQAARAGHFDAQWQLDYLEEPLPVEYTITFKFYTNDSWIIERLNQDRAKWRDGFLVIEVPVTPGAPRYTWRDQELLKMVLNQGDIQTESNGSGRAFWGWFTEETLNSSGRVSGDLGLRRPTLTDRNELEYILLQIEGADDLGTRKGIFGSNTERNLTLFGLWALWGDVNDDESICVEDLELIRQYISYGPLTIEPISMNVVAGKVTLDGILGKEDFELLRRYLSYGHFPGINILLGGFVPHM